MSTRTFTPARALAASASTNCFSSLPSVQTNVSRCTLCFAAAMSASIAGKIAPFCSTVDAVALVNGAFREPREHRQRVLDLRVVVGVELQVRRAAIRGEHDVQHAQQRCGHRGHYDPGECRHTVPQQTPSAWAPFRLQLPCRVAHPAASGPHLANALRAWKGPRTTTPSTSTDASARARRSAPLAATLE